MKVRYGRQLREFDRPMRVRDILVVMDIVPEGVIVAVNGDLVTSDTLAEPGDDVEVIRAISGG